MTTTTTTTVRREVEVDTKLAELWAAGNKAHGELDSAKSSLAFMLNIKGERLGRGYKRTIIESLDELIGMAQERDLMPWEARSRDETITRVDELRAELVKLADEVRPLNEEYDEKRWSRFFLVTNHDGHIHSSMHCSTCRITTAFAWLPELSGLTEADAVAAHGPHLCTVCFPTAPVEWTMGEQKDTSDRCPGSGTWDHNSSGIHYYQRRAECNHCGETTSVTSTGKLRAHKKKDA